MAPTAAATPTTPTRTSSAARRPASGARATRRPQAGHDGDGASAAAADTDTRAGGAEQRAAPSTTRTFSADEIAAAQQIVQEAFERALRERKLDGAEERPLAEAEANALRLAVGTAVVQGLHQRFPTLGADDVTALVHAVLPSLQP